MLKDRKVRTAITRESLWYFFHLYFAHYVKYATAPFQAEMFSLIEDENVSNLFIVAFRGSGKSTIITTAYPIWSILGKQQKKFVLILCQTQVQAKQHMRNLRQELENNSVLKDDLGPFKEEADEWGSFSLVFAEHGARITAASSEQSIRGLRHNQHRPDLIIGDDVEDIASTKTREGRDKTFQWFTGEVIPTGDRTTRIIVIGNLLHEDSLLMRLKERVEKKTINGVFKEYPLVTKDGQILWIGKYPTLEEVESEKLRAGNEFAWQREYMLKIVPADDQAIYREWIQYYDEIPPPTRFKSGYSSYREVRIGVDPAISKSAYADYTAMVPGLLYEVEDGYRVYVLPRIINKRMNFPETVDMCRLLETEYHAQRGAHPSFVVEDVGYQKALPQQLEKEGIRYVKMVRPGTTDKRTRIVLTASAIKNGRVLFPREGAEELVQQLVHLGVEKHDDLADAFANLVHSTYQDPPVVPRIYWI